MPTITEVGVKLDVTPGDATKIPSSDVESLAEPSQSIFKKKICKIESLTLESSDSVLCATFSEDGSMLAFGGMEKTAKIVDTCTGDVVHTLDAKEPVAALSFCRDATKEGATSRATNGCLAVGTLSGTLILYDVTSPTCANRELVRLLQSILN